MSATLALITAAAEAVASPASPVPGPPVTDVTIVAAAPVGATPAAPLDQVISLAIPSTDGARGAQVSYERQLARRRWSLAASGELRESAIGDYTGLRIGAGGEARWYWREARRAWLSRLPAGHLVGWFVGGGVSLAFDLTHDHADHRWLGTAVSVGISGKVGYRIAPWRAVVITPSTGLAVHHDMDVSGRLPGWTRGGLIVGLDVGWLF